MAADAPDIIELDEQDQSEMFDETNLDDNADFVTLDEMADVFDATQALGDGRDILALDAADLDPEALDDEDLEQDQAVDDGLDDDLEDAGEDDKIDVEELDDEDRVTELELDEADIESLADVEQVTDADDEETDAYESEELSDEQLRELGYANDAGEKKPGSNRPEDVAEESDPHQEDLLDEGVEETFPASDPVSVKRIT